MTSTQLAERRLAERYGFAEAVLFGRARSALATLVDALAPARDFAAVIPAALCGAVPAAIWAAGAEVRLADVDSTTGLARDDDMVALMRGAPRPGLAMPVHLFGFVAPSDETVRAAGERGWFVLENDTNAALADGGRRPAGDAVLLSFGGGKVLDAAGGGALLSNDAALVRELRHRAERYPPLDAAAEATEQYLTLLKRQLRAGVPGRGSLAGLSEQLLPYEFAELRYGFDSTLAEPLLDALDRLPEALARRRERAALWRNALAPLGDRIVLPDGAQPAPWRLVAVLPGGRDAVVAALRGAGIDAGTNYPPLTDSYPVRLGGQTRPGAEAWARRVLNLWLTEAYDRTRITAAVDLIERTLAALPEES